MLLRGQECRLLENTVARSSNKMFVRYPPPNLAIPIFYFSNMLRSHLLTSTKRNGVITPLDLMTVFFLVQPGVWLASFTTKMCCWLVCDPLLLQVLVSRAPSLFLAQLTGRSVLSWSSSLYFFLLNFQDSLMIQSLISARSHWNEDLPLIYHPLPLDHWRICWGITFSTSRQLMRILSNIGPSIDVCHAPLVTSCQTVVESLISTWWDQKSGQLSGRHRVWPACASSAYQWGCGGRALFKVLVK